VTPEKIITVIKLKLQVEGLNYVKAVRRALNTGITQICVCTQKHERKACKALYKSKKNGNNSCPRPETSLYLTVADALPVPEKISTMLGLFCQLKGIPYHNTVKRSLLVP